MFLNNWRDDEAFFAQYKTPDPLSFGELVLAAIFVTTVLAYIWLTS